MAGTTTTATLGLVITARDDAKAVFEQFAINVAEQMAKIQESMNNSFKMDGLVANIEEACTRMEEAFVRVTEAESQIGRVQSINEMQSQMTALSESVTRMSEEVTRGFENINRQTTEINNNMHSMASGLNFGEMMNAGMIMQGYGEKIVGFIDESVKAGAEFDQSMKNTTASLNANLSTTKLTTDQIDAMSRAALQMGSDGFFSANQIAEAMNTMGKQGLSYQTIMSGGIETVKNVAAANQQDLEQTANVVSDIYNEMSGEFNKMGMTTQQSAQVIGNSMTVALHSARLSMDDFLNTIKYVGPEASSVGMTIQDVSAGIALLGEHGIKASQAGTTLRRMLTNLTPASKEAEATMKQLGMITADGGNIFYDSSGKMKSFADVQQILHDKLSGLSPEMEQLAIKTIFGQYALGGMMAITNSTSGDISKLTDRMKENGLMQQIMNEKQQGLVMQTQKLTAHFATLQKEIGLMLAPVLTSLVMIANKVMDSWEKLSPSMQKSIVYFTAITGAVLLIGGTILTFIGTMGMLGTSFMAVMGSLAGAGATFTTIGRGIAILGTVVAGLHAIWTKDIGGIQQYTQRFADWFSGIFSKTMATAKKDVDHGISELTKGFGGWDVKIMGPVNRVFSQMWSTISSSMQKVIQVVANGITGVTSWFNKMAPDFNKALHQIVDFLVWAEPVWKALWVVIKFAVSMAIDWIVGIVQHFWGVFSGIIQLFTHIINGQWKQAFGDLWQIVKNSFLLVLDLWGGGAGKIVGFFGKIIEHSGLFGKALKLILGPAFKFIETIVKFTVKVAEGVFSGGMKIIEGVLKGFSGMVQLIWKAVRSLFEAHSSGAMEVLTRLWRVGFNLVKTLAMDWWRGVKDVFDLVKDVLTGHFGDAITKFKDLFMTGFNAVKTIVSTWWSGVSAIFTTIKNVIVQVASDIWVYVESAWDIGTKFVIRIAKSLWDGAKNIFTGLKDDITNLVKQAWTFITDIFQREIIIVQYAINSFKYVISSVWQGIKDLISGHSSEAMAFFQRAFQVGITAVGNIVRGIFGIIDSVLGGLPSKMYQWAQNGINMFVSGIKNGIGAIGSAVSGVADTIKNFLGMHSPAKMGPLGSGESDQWFPNMMKMFEQGINDNKDKVVKATMGVAVGVQQSIQATSQQVHSFVGNSAASTGSIVNNSANQRQQVVNINIDGRSKQTDKQLAEDIAKQFRTQMSMVMG